MNKTHLRVPLGEALVLGFQGLRRLNREDGFSIHCPDISSLADNCPGYALEAPVSVTKYPDAQRLNTCCLLQAVVVGAAQFRSSSDDHVVAEEEHDAVARLGTIVGELLQECEDFELCDWDLVR